MTQKVKRPVYGAYRFFVEIEGLAEAAFSECSGLQVETEVFEWEEGGSNGFRHRLPGRSKYQNLVLKRGVATANLWKWYFDAIEGKVKRRTLSVILCGYSGMSDVRWNFADAVPVKWSGPTFRTGATEAAVETLELAHHGFKRV
jgi:phage tail-like protein